RFAPSREPAIASTWTRRRLRPARSCRSCVKRPSCERTVGSSRGGAAVRSGGKARRIRRGSADRAPPDGTQGKPRLRRHAFDKRGYSVVLPRCRPTTSTRRGGERKAPAYED